MISRQSQEMNVLVTQVLEEISLIVALSVEVSVIPVSQISLSVTM